MKSNKGKDWIWILLSWSVIIIGFLFILFPPFNDWSWQPDSTLFSDYGDFAGALFSLAGFILLYLTLRAQQEDIQIQKNTSDTERFETTFFNLLSVQQNITNDLKIYDPYSRSKNIFSQGREIFAISLRERNRINCILSCDNYYGIYKEEDMDEYERAVESLYDMSNLENDPFFNILDEKRKIDKTQRVRIVNKIYNITKDTWDKGHQLKKRERVIFVYQILFEKFDYALGHYFRNLYHIMNFVNEFERSQIKKTSDSKERKEIQNRCSQYAKFIQAQMSSFELALLHDNALKFDKTCLPLVQKYDFVEHMPKKYLIDECRYID